MFQSETAISPMSIYRHLSDISSKLQPGRQEDAHEFFDFLLDALHVSDLKTFSRKSSNPNCNKQQQNSIVYGLFGGCIRSQVQCLSCHNISNSFQTVLSISLEVTDRLERALRHYTDTETLQTDNQYYCPKCKKRRDANKQLTIFSTPPIFVLHLKRFSSEYSNFGYTSKIHKHMSFPETLKFGSYMSDQSCDPEYTLHGVLVHSGYSGNNGHYICFVKDPSGKWHQIDDHFVMEVSIKKVLSQQAYMLFYTLSNNTPLRNTRPTVKYFQIPDILAKWKKKQVRTSQQKKLSSLPEDAKARRTKPRASAPARVPSAAPRAPAAPAKQRSDRGKARSHKPHKGSARSSAGHMPRREHRTSTRTHSHHDKLHSSSQKDDHLGTPRTIDPYTSLPSSKLGGDHRSNPPSYHHSTSHTRSSISSMTSYGTGGDYASSVGASSVADIYSSRSKNRPRARLDSYGYPSRPRSKSETKWSRDYLDTDADLDDRLAGAMSNGSHLSNLSGLRYSFSSLGIHRRGHGSSRSVPARGSSWQRA